MAETARLLRNGKITAIKGLGGFHLSCDARNAEAVHELRRRKARDAMPFALMTRTVSGIARYCHVDAAADDLLQSPAAPMFPHTALRHHACGGRLRPILPLRKSRSSSFQVGCFRPVF